MKRGFFKLMVLLGLMLCVACVSKKNIVDEVVIEDSPPKLIFLNYSISKDENNKKNIQFVSKIVADGKLKTNSSKYMETGGVGDLKCSQLTKDSVEVASIIIKNPLSKNIEFVNDSLIFENKKVDLKKTYFSIRLQLHSKTVFIAIKELTDSLQNSHTLIINKIN
jgi:hypothetical protein